MNPDEFLDGVINDLKGRISDLQGEAQMNYLMGIADGIQLAAPSTSLPRKIEAFLQFVQSLQAKAVRDKMEDRSNPNENQG